MSVPPKIPTKLVTPTWYNVEGKKGSFSFMESSNLDQIYKYLTKGLELLWMIDFATNSQLIWKTEQFAASCKFLQRIFTTEISSAYITASYFWKQDYLNINGLNDTSLPELSSRILTRLSPKTSMELSSYL